VGSNKGTTTLTCVRWNPRQIWLYNSTHAIADILTG